MLLVWVLAHHVLQHAHSLLQLWVCSQPPSPTFRFQPALLSLPLRAYRVDPSRAGKVGVPRKALAWRAAHEGRLAAAARVRCRLRAVNGRPVKVRKVTQPYPRVRLHRYDALQHQARLWRN